MSDRLAVWWRWLRRRRHTRRLGLEQRRRRELLAAVDPLSVQWRRDARYTRVGHDR